MDKWTEIKNKHSEAIANIFSGSATPGQDLCKAVRDGLIKRQDADFLANNWTGGVARTAEEAARIESDFERRYDI